MAAAVSQGRGHLLPIARQARQSTTCRGSGGLKHWFLGSIHVGDLFIVHVSNEGVDGHISFTSRPKVMVTPRTWNNVEIAPSLPVVQTS